MNENRRREQALQTKPIGWLQLILLMLPGIAPYYFYGALTVVWGIVILLTLYAFISGKAEWIWYCIAASPVLEVWSRMSKASYVPFEIGKYYLLLALPLILWYHIRHRSYPPAYRTGMIMLLVLIPSLIIGFTAFDREQWVFNILPILELGALLMLTARERWTIERFGKTLRWALIPILPFLVHLALRAPVISELSFVLSANAEAAGGFGSNQVSTILANSIVIVVVLLIIGYPLFPFKWMSYVLIGYLAFRGLLTFSRGGTVTAVLSIAVAIIPAMFASTRGFARNMGLIMFLTVFGLGLFWLINNYTGDKLLQRYLGETAGTLSGTRIKTLNVATSGRSELINADFKIFAGNFLFGVSPVEARHLRGKFGALENSAAHTEFTRLLSEHGIGGLCTALILLIFPLIWVRKQKFSAWKKVSSALFALAILTSLHSAMRTNTTVVFYVLAAIPVVMNSHWFMKFKNSD